MKQTFKSILLLLLTGALCNGAYAQAGSSGLSFLKLGVSGRGISMGDAMSANVEGAAATYYNPAGLFGKGEASSQILLMHREWIQDVRAEFLGVSFRLDDQSAMGFAVNTATVSDIEIRTRPGAVEGTFTSRDFSAGVSCSRVISDELNVGITAKFLYEKIFLDESNGLAVDLGAQYKLNDLSLGLSFSNLGSMNTFRNEKTVLPALARVGPAYSFELDDISSRLVVASDLLYIFPEKKSYVNFGGELLFNNIIAARAGYQAGSNSRGFSAGVGVLYGMFSLDYGFVPLSSNLGSGHTFSIGLKF
ncbi:MAG: PorV/PorQ family protein [bacterium]